MKKYTIVFLTFLSFSFSGISQNFAPIGAKWHYSADDYSPPFNSNYILIESVKDTIVQGKNAKKLNSTFFGGSGGSSPWAINIVYSDSNKVYLYRYNQFHLLYDFNANQGDTMYIIEPELGSCGGNGDTLIEILVDSVKMENIGGVMKKVQYVTNLEFGWVIGAKFIETVGSTHYLFPIHCTLPPIIDSLRCYSDSTINYQLVVDCEELVTAINEYKKTEYTIQTIVLNQLKLPDITGDFLIYDLQGRIILSEKIKTTINISNLNKGIYILILKTKDAQTKHKLIKL